MFTVQTLTCIGWINVPYMQYPSKSTAYRYQRNYRLAHPQMTTRVVAL